MTPVILATSALMALLKSEPGADAVQKVLPEAVISTVTLAEVVTRLAVTGMPENEIREVLNLLGLETASIDDEMAFLTGMLEFQDCRLSIGDRACLALAAQRNGTVFTADPLWRELRIPAICIQFIR